MIYPPNPRFEWHGGTVFELMEALFIEALGRSFWIPKGFISDGASVPRPFWPLVSPMDCGELAPLVHDYLYRTGGVDGRFTRKEADQIFRQHMKDAGVPLWRRQPVYLAVRVAGRHAWKSRTINY